MIEFNNLPDGAQKEGDKFIIWKDGRIVELYPAGDDTSMPERQDAPQDTPRFELKISGDDSQLETIASLLGFTVPARETSRPEYAPEATYSYNDTPSYPSLPKSDYEASPPKYRYEPPAELYDEEENEWVHKPEGRISKRYVGAAALLSLALVSGPVVQAYHSGDEANAECDVNSIGEAFGNFGCLANYELNEIFLTTDNVLKIQIPEE